jgi:uncharacterized repeat protein (TIGR02543 family)
MKPKRKSLAVITLLALLLQSVILGFLPSPAVAVTTCAQGGRCIVGDIGPGGGIVFYVAGTPFTATGTPCGTNCYYLEAAPTSGTNAWTDAEYAWSGNTNTEIGGTGTAIGSGYANTLAIVGQSGGGSTASRAGTITRAYRGPNNLSDWYLPSKSELAELWNQWNQRSISDLVLGRYFWSSSESQPCCAWVNKFDPNNTINDFAKYSSAYVRPIRAFSNTPGAPTIGTVAANGATAISIPYTAGAISGSAITGYTTTSSPFVSLTLTSTATASPLTYSGTFVQGQSYTFTIAATNDAGSGAASSASNSVTPFAAGPPDAPTIGIGTVIDSQTVSIPFTAPANNGSSITSYSVSSSPSIALTYSGTTSPMAVTGTFVQGQAYTFTIAATNGAGSGAASSASNSVTPFAAGPPDAPTIGIGTVIDSQTVSIPFTTPASNGSSITSYSVSSSPSIALTYSGTTSPMAVTGTFVQGQSYTFTIAATNGAGSGAASSASNSVTPFAAGPPDAPTIGIGTVIDSQTVSIPFTAPANNGSSITSYSVSSSPSIALTYSGTTSPMAVTGTFVQGQSYTFTIAATNGAGSGAASSASNSVTPFAAGPPDAPTIGIGTVIDSQTVTVSFSAPVNNRGATITNYTATSSPGGITASSANSPITVTGLTVNTAYTFTVTATNSAGTSDSSTATSSITPKMTYSVTFNSQGGSSISDGSFISGESVTAPGSNPTRSGYTYNGWFAAATGGSVLVFPYSPGVTSNITLYAQWTAIPVVIPPAPAPAPVVVTGPPPSTLKTISAPKISRDDKSYYCEVGKYVFLREGRTEETPKLTTQVFSLLVNGKVIDSVKSVIDRVSFANSDSYLNSTLTCQVEVGQENLSTTSYSLNSADIASYSLVKKNANEAADAKYYKDRQDAYTRKDLEFARLLEIKNAGVASSKTSKEILAASLAYQKAYSAASNLWKKELADAATNRVLAKELAQTQYLDALESAGISIYQTPGKEVVTPTPTPTPTPEPTPTPTSTPVVTTNPQPTAQMVKVGTINMASGSYSLNDATKITLKAIALKISASDAKSILVYGHTDSRGGVNNTVLSQNRAKAVANYLRPLFKGKKITVGWYASRKPVAGGNTAADLAKNRRVEIYSK